MQENRLTVLGCRRCGPPWSELLTICRHLELIEQSPGRCTVQFETDHDPLASLQPWSRRRPGLTLLLQYEKQGITGLARLKGGVITRHEIKH